MMIEVNEADAAVLKDVARRDKKLAGVVLTGSDGITIVFYDKNGAVRFITDPVKRIRVFGKEGRGMYELCDMRL